MFVYSRWLFWAIALLAPFLVANYYLGKDYFHVLLLFSLPVAVWFAWSRNDHTQKIYRDFQTSNSESLVRWGVILFLLSIVPSYFMQNSIGLTRYAPAVELRLMYLIPLFFAPVFWLSGIQFRLKHFWLMVTIAGLVVSMATLVDVYTGAERYDRVHGHPIPFGNLSLLIGVWALLGASFFSQNWSLSQKLFMIILGFGGLIASAYSGTRGGWIAIPMIALLLWKWRILSSHVFISVLVLVIFVLILLLSFENTVSHRIWLAVDEVRRLWQTQGAFDGGSIGSRFAMWSVAWQAFLSAPLFGIGIGEFYAFKMQFVQQGLLGEHLARFKHAHNEYLSILSNQGLIGIIVFGWWFTWLWKIFARASQSINQEKRSIGVMGGVMMVAYLDFCLSESMLTSQVGGVFFMVSLVLFLLVLDNAEKT